MAVRRSVEGGTLFYRQDERIDLFFKGTELASEGLPQGKEREILESLRTRCRPREGGVGGGGGSHERTGLHSLISLLSGKVQAIPAVLAHFGHAASDFTPI